MHIMLHVRLNQLDKIPLIISLLLFNSLFIFFIQFVSMRSFLFSSLILDLLKSVLRLTLLYNIEFQNFPIIKTYPALISLPVSLVR